MEFAGTQEWLDRHRLVNGVERNDWVWSDSSLLLVSFAFEFCVFFVDLGAVEQDDLHDVHCCLGGVDGTVESLLDESWEESAVVKVCMGEHDGINFPGIDLERFPVSVLQAAFLVESAVDEDFLSAGFEEVLRSRDVLCGAIES